MPWQLESSSVTENSQWLSSPRKTSLALWMTEMWFLSHNVKLHFKKQFLETFLPKISNGKVLFVFLWIVSLHWKIQDYHSPPIFFPFMWQVRRLFYLRWEIQVETSALHLKEKIEGNPSFEKIQTDFKPISCLRGKKKTKKLIFILTKTAIMTSTVNILLKIKIIWFCPWSKFCWTEKS